MSKSLSITVHPSALSAEYLSVSDAMNQVLDLVKVLEEIEIAQGDKNEIVWRLTEAHTNSPPLSVTVEAFSSGPEIFIDSTAEKVIENFSHGVDSLLTEGKLLGFSQGAVRSIKKAFLRNMNGIGQTDISIGDSDVANFTPLNSQSAVFAIERFELDMKESVVDHTRTEFGSLELEVQGILQWYNKPALKVVERLSREEATCVLTQELADRLGATYKWGDAWEGRRLLITGALHYGTDNTLRRVEAEDAEDISWTDVPLTDLKDIDILQGRSVREHIDLLRGDDIG